MKRKSGIAAFSCISLIDFFSVFRYPNKHVRALYTQVLKKEYFLHYFVWGRDEVKHEKESFTIRNLFNFTVGRMQFTSKRYCRDC